MIRKVLIVFRCMLIVIAFMHIPIVHAQAGKHTQIVDSISVAYKNMHQYHMHVQTKVTISGEQIASQIYDIYKQGEKIYLTSKGMEVLYNSSMVLMVLKEQKQIVVRPVTAYELQSIKKFEAPVIDSMNKSRIFKDFSETENGYEFTVYAAKGQIVQTTYCYDKQSYLLKQVNISYADTDDSKNQRTVILYSYLPLSTSSSYFNSEKYLTKTKSGYTATAAYSNYFINNTSTYEK
jgi:hypothetical protein